MERPKLAITMGDVAGIGPEVIVRAFESGQLEQYCRPLVVGHPDVLDRAIRLAGSTATLLPIEHLADWPTAADISPGNIACWNPANDDAAAVPAGRLDRRAGQSAYAYLVAATRAAVEGDVDALTTAPLNKAALQLAGFDYPGHTEILAERCGCDTFAMMLYLPPGPAVVSAYGLGVVHVTLHTSIRSVPDLLSKQAVAEKIELMERFLGDIGCAAPRIGVCALNPHAGESGLFGEEEQQVIAPAVAAALDSGIDASGPLPADTLLKRAVDGEFDGVVAMYHDQGHIALKLIGFDQAVNVTLGLPIVRTSPSHGTAFDIAWKGLARADGMLAAVRVASSLAQQRRSNRVASS